uniref:Late embryogenesis abundant protein LEA-2 subgroup domain-containing protein n=1 Tax=Oryza punctata TaxID=4537 RepID=A0A0E0KL83_ORYPU
MCYESECCGGRGSYRYRRFALGFWFGLAILAAITVTVVLAVGYGRVSRLSVAVDDASLTRFTVTATSVAYNLTVALVVRNPNWAMGVTYRSLEAAYLFNGKRFDSVTVVSSGYEQAARKTAVFRLSSGSDAAQAALGSAGEKEYRKESDNGGVFDVEVDLSGEVKYALHSTWCRVEARCPLKLQLAASGAGSVVFQKTTCDMLRSSQGGC